MRLSLYPDSSLVYQVCKLSQERIVETDDIFIVDGRLVMDPMQLICAAHQALAAAKAGKIRTRSVNQEVIYRLSGSGNVEKSLKVFGNPVGTVVVGSLGLTQEELSERIGEPNSSSDLVPDLNFIGETYGVGTEASTEKILHSILNIISTKGL